MTGGGAIGPKAESLQRLKAAGLPVPEARFLGVEAYLEHASRAGVGSLVSARAAPADVRRAIASTPLAEEVVSLLREWHAELGDQLAVRSSGTAEDLPHASFAGQHGTYFVASADDLVSRVRDCWASLYSDRAVAYRETKDIPHENVAMAVIVQHVVPAVAAGVVFTRDPVTGEERVLVESCLGIGEALVSGKVTPDRFTFSADGLGLLAADFGNKRVRIAPDPRGGLTEVVVSPDEAAIPSVEEATACEVARLALATEAAFGAPVDVEWAWDGERVWLLQARPITTNPAPTAASAEPVIWSNVNTGEILPDVATPMTWSIIHHHANDIIGGMLGALGARIDAQKAIGLVGGRFYFNLTLLRDAFAHLPGVDPDIALGGMHDFVDLPPLQPSGMSRTARARALARAVLSMPTYIARHTPRRSVTFAARMRRRSEDAMRVVASRPDVAESYRLVVSLNDDFAEFNEALAYMAVAMLGYGLLGTLTGRWLGDTMGATATRLVAGQGGVASAEAGHAMWRLSTLARGATSVSSAVLVGSGWDDVRGRLHAAADAGDGAAADFLSEWDDFMREHGHHRRGELEFANASWAETPDYVLGIVRSYLVDDRGSDPIAVYEQRALDADRAAQEVFARLRGPRRAFFMRALAWGRAGARTRENVKSEVVRWLVSLRHALLALGASLVDPGVLRRADDIFFVEYGELPALVSGEPGVWRAIVDARRAEHERLEKLSPPPVVVGTWDETSGPWMVDHGSRTLKGIPVSSGVARGPARVFLTVDTEEPVMPGEILVAPFTDPGWTPYFVPAAGIVMDMGGLLSHGSIIAREYGIPAVVNVGPATQLIRTGQLIEVDGNTGEVRILG
ncbi:MAG: PEP/pyruvate-binding domain-containing protein [Coriobacteriia bacterium]|nr:PEP/pyruvate-binding domain-containing protein [Coriobacteriia bacterium]